MPITKCIMFNMILLHVITGISLKNICIALHILQSPLMHGMPFTPHKTIYGK